MVSDDSEIDDDQRKEYVEKSPKSQESEDFLQEEGQMVDCGNLVTEASIQSESSDALINPLTPLPLQSKNFEFVNSGVEWNWRTRDDLESEVSLVISKGNSSV